VKGSIREKRRGVFELRVTLGRDPYTHKLLQRSETFRGSRRDAETRLSELVVAATNNRLGNRHDTVASALDRWLEHRTALRLSPTTLKNYESKVNRIKTSSLGSVPLPKLRASQIDAFYRELMDAGNSATTVHHYHRILSSALTYAENQDWINWEGRSPVSKAAPPAPDSPEAFKPSVEQVLRLIDAAETSRQPAMADFYRVAALTGMRRGEVCGLRWSDIDWTRGTLTVRRSIYQIPGEVGEKTTKNKRTKRIMMGDPEIHLFSRLLEQAESEATEAQVDLRPNGFVFSGSEDGTTPWTPNGVTQFTTRLRNRLDIPDFHLHSLRHWSGTSLVEAGIDIRNVAGGLGHSDGGTLLLSRYAHRSDEQDRKAGKVLSTLLGLPGAASDA